MFNGLSVQSKYDKLKADSPGASDTLRVNSCSTSSDKDMKYNTNAARIPDSCQYLCSCNKNYTGINGKCFSTTASVYTFFCNTNCFPYTYCREA